MEGIIDRFEEDKVLLEIEEGILIFDKELFPEDIEEGDIVEYIDDKFVIKEEETRKRRKHIESLFQSLIDDKK